MDLPTAEGQRGPEALPFPAVRERHPSQPAWSPEAVHILGKPTGAICNLGCSYCFFLDKELLYEGDRFRMSDEVLEAYLQVQQVRHGDDLVLECRIEPECRAGLVPHLLLQPLAENSLRHGLGAGGGPGRLVLEARRAGDRLLMELHDNGRGLPDEITEGRGLANVRARLGHLHRLTGVDELECHV